MHRYILKDNLKVYNVPLADDPLATLDNVSYTYRQKINICVNKECDIQCVL